ncbi:MAG: hypothetical protein EWV83_10185 [Microcystis sp. M_OC_Ca_00000000_S217Cul]|uniref:Uncharacterized protein n=4 Tax=Microcystis TaxID=1125 RepID=A0A841UZP4_MICAE|nr:hypothetical protein VL20_3757 [Microcystis panniformis FACHB-1757]MBC1193486.1 hypothetical protein [Microcystis aeruginosa BLCC-F108]TRT76790.1 MAG: hypothetical protein EWV83_10185 [Microcystis sp. M_OC_Ca_00000000_S217Cul]TRT93631.1 MAG: hypothetical protein EWV66_02400 [Microcystis sp. M_OC_Ca_00000000_C217Col]
MVNFFNVFGGKISQKSLREPMNDFWEVRMPIAFREYLSAISPSNLFLLAYIAVNLSLVPFFLSPGGELGGNLDKLKVSAIPIETIPA